MEEKIEFEEKDIIREIFLNLLISAFIIMAYFYTSETFGSISTKYIDNSEFSILFGITILILALLSVLTKPIHGLISGFIGELLYQLAFYDEIYVEWCSIVAIFGFMCGIYGYKPLKYQDKQKIVYTVIFLLISSLITAIFISIIGVNNGLQFFLEALISVVFLVPLLLIGYDKVFASKERGIYHELLTHHPPSQNDHAFYLQFGRTRFYFCTRCSGMVIGGIIAVFWSHLIEVIYDIKFSPELALLLCVILPIPGLIDWGTQRMLYRKSTTESRLFTGFILGHSLHFLSFTRPYYLFMTIILILYFGIFFIMMFLGQRKEIRRIKAAINNMPKEEDNRIIDDQIVVQDKFKEEA